MKRSLAGLLLAMVLVPMGTAVAHPLAPGLLELTEVAPARYAVLWRTSVARARTGTVEPRLPQDCARVSQPEVRIESGEAQVSRWVIQCGAGGLAGQPLSVDGLDGSGINVIVRVTAPGRPEFKALLGPGQLVTTVATLQPEPVFARYLELGAQHLLGGLDHLLFLLGLFLLVPSLRALVATVTAFTAGHSVTLSLAALGLVPIGQGLAELMIAATVLVLGLELAKKGSGSFSEQMGSGSFSADASSPKMNLTPFLAKMNLTPLLRRPCVMAGAFGLVHGLGFAGALRDLGLPAQDVPRSLLAFNLGIEGAQLALICGMLLAAAVWRRLPAAPRFAQAVPAYVVGSMAACWLLERSVTLLA